LATFWQLFDNFLTTFENVIFLGISFFFISNP
jgi:hypothetical protein